MRNLITQLRIFYNRNAVAVLLFFIFLFLYLLVSPFFKLGITLVAYYRRIPAFILLYCCVILLYKQKSLSENKLPRLLRRLFCGIMLLLSPVIGLLACVGMPEDNGWDVRCQQRMPYKGMYLAEWFYGGGATVSNNLKIRIEKQLLPGLLFVKELYSSEGEDSLLLRIQNDTLYIKDPWNKNLLDRQIDLQSGVYIDKNIPQVERYWKC